MKLRSFFSSFYAIVTANRDSFRLPNALTRFAFVRKQIVLLLFLTQFKPIFMGDSLIHVRFFAHSLVVIIIYNVMMPNEISFIAVPCRPTMTRSTTLPVFRNSFTSNPLLATLYTKTENFATNTDTPSLPSLTNNGIGSWHTKVSQPNLFYKGNFSAIF